MSYHRVTPRDLFNESKLLKCLGFISLMILDHRLPYELHEELTDPKSGFKIRQDDDGNISCSNYSVWMETKSMGPFHLHFHSPLNSKLNFPLICHTFTEDMIFVFNDDGKISKEFNDYLKLVSEFTP